MAEESKSGNSSSDGGGDAEQEEGASQGGGDASRASRSGPPSVPFPLLTTRELLQQHVDAQLQQLEAGEIRELSLQTMWTMDVLASTQTRSYFVIYVLLLCTLLSCSLFVCVCVFTQCTSNNVCVLVVRQ